MPGLRPVLPARLYQSLRPISLLVSSVLLIGFALSEGLPAAASRLSFLGESPDDITMMLLV